MASDRQRESGRGLIGLAASTAGYGGPAVGPRHAIAWGRLGSLDPGAGCPLQSTPWQAAGPALPTSRRTESIRRMSRRYVNQLSHGDSVDESYLVADKQLRANRQGNLYLQLELRDKTGSVGARLWNATEELARSFEPGDYLHVRGKTQIFQGSLQIILTHIDVLDRNRIEAEDFLPQSSQNVAKLMARLARCCWR